MINKLESLEQEYAKHLIGHTRPITWLNQIEGICRSRIITGIDPTEIITVQDIWYRDQSSLKPQQQSIGRCHYKGENFFYSSNQIETTVLELNPNDQDILLTGVFKVKKYAPPPASVFAGIEILKNSAMFNHILGNYKYDKPEDADFEKEIASRFQRQVTTIDSEEYLHTIALSRILLKNEDHQCLIYPSVASNLRLINYGFKSEFVDHYLYCDKIAVYKLKRHKRFFKLTPVLFGKIDQNQKNPKESKISWKSPINDKEVTKGTFLYLIN